MMLDKLMQFLLLIKVQKIKIKILQEYPETQGPNEPIEVDTRNAFMKAIALNGKIKAKIWRAVELMEREEMRTMIVITNYNGGLRVPALPQGDIHFV